MLSFVLVFCWLAPVGNARDGVPEKTRKLVQQLHAAQPQTIGEGLYAIKVTAGLLTLTAVTIKAGKRPLKLVLQSKNTGMKVSEFGEEYGAVIAINGGFFSADRNNIKTPVGRLVFDDTAHSKAWTSTGGYLIFQDGNLSLVPANGQAVPKRGTILQSKPVLIEPDGKWAMNSNRPIAKSRSLVCLHADGDYTLVVMGGLGLSLYEAGWVLRSREVGGYFGCDSAIALDGGGSSQLWVKNHPEFGVFGNTPVHNAIIVPGLVEN